MSDKEPSEVPANVLIDERLRDRLDVFLDQISKHKKAVVAAAIFAVTEMTENEYGALNRRFKAWLSRGGLPEELPIQKLLETDPKRLTGRERTGGETIKPGGKK